MISTEPQAPFVVIAIIFRSISGASPSTDYDLGTKTVLQAQKLWWFAIQAFVLHIIVEQTSIWHKFLGGHGIVHHDLLHSEVKQISQKPIL